MAYAGICLGEDLQSHSDPFFHAASLDEIVSYITSAGVNSIPAKTATNNNPPVVSGGNAYTIPMGTPFLLTAVGSDSDGDVVSYCWEEMDLGQAGPPNDDALELRPLFRSLSPDTKESRVFPSMQDLLAGLSPLGDILPTRNRTLAFRVTARDNRSGGGSFSSSMTSVSVVTDSGPFKINEPQSTAVWKAGSTQTLTWNAAGTASAPISCSNVKISISIDGGQTFTPLIQSTANIGSTTLVLPQTPATTARIKIEAIGNIFFNISPAFKIASAN